MAEKCPLSSGPGLHNPILPAKPISWGPHIVSLRHHQTWTPAAPRHPHARAQGPSAHSSFPALSITRTHHLSSPPPGLLGPANPVQTGKVNHPRPCHTATKTCISPSQHLWLHHSPLRSRPLKCLHPGPFPRLPVCLSSCPQELPLTQNRNDSDSDQAQNKLRIFQRKIRLPLTSHRFSGSDHNPWVVPSSSFVPLPYNIQQCTWMAFFKNGHHTHHDCPSTVLWVRGATSSLTRSLGSVLPEGTDRPIRPGGDQRPADPSQLGAQVIS